MAKRLQTNCENKELDIYMKKQNLPKVFVYFFATTLIVIGCQKAPNKSITPAATDSAKIDTEAKILANVCSAEFLNLTKALNDDQATASQIYEKMTLKKDAELDKSYRQIAQKQVDHCHALVQQMDKEKISSCQKSDSDTSEENRIDRKTIEESCKSIENWNKSITAADTTVAETSVPKTIQIQFNETGLKLIQSKSVAEFLYFSRGEIKSGQDAYKQDALAGNIACVFSNQSENENKSSTFKYVTESKATTADIGFEFKGNSSLITLQDSKNAVISVVCLNLEPSSEKERFNSLKKLFGNLLTLKEMSEADAKSSFESVEEPQAAPALELVPVLVDEKNEVSAAAIAKEEKSKSLDETLDKAQKTIQTVLKDSLAETKKTATELTKESIAEAQKASSALLVQAEVTAKNLILQSQTSATALVNDSKMAAKEVVDQAQTAGSILITQSGTTATAVIDQGIKKSQAASAVVITNGINEAKLAANEVVDLGIRKTQKAAADTAKAPFRWIKEKANNTWNGFTNFFTSKNKKTIQTKKIEQKK